jgi:predicted N-acetyltransferase YhbS
MIEYDEAGSADDDAVRALLASANEGYRAILDPAAFDPYMAMVLAIEQRSASSQLLVARDGECLVGTVTFFPAAADEGWGARPGSSGIRAMAVAPAARGRGVGQTLVAACVERAREAGASEWLPDAIRLYERCGFVRDPDSDLRASEIMNVPAHADYTALGYRLPLDRTRAYIGAGLSSKNRAMTSATSSSASQAGAR